ncbi:MAG: hypothetical protein IT370_32125, partial [Deltaproteobacteria bacterium]|nr:hypothetical protein [Deltaproteobacteria bacterium]
KDAPTPHPTDKDGPPKMPAPQNDNGEPKKIAKSHDEAMDDLRTAIKDKKKLDDGQVRDLYLKAESQIEHLNKQWEAEGISVEERAKRAYDLRKDARETARDLMQDQTAVQKLRDRDTKKYGQGDGPTFEQLMKKHMDAGMTEAQAHKEIIESSQRSDKATNDKHGLQGKDSKSGEQGPKMPSAFVAPDGTPVTPGTPEHAAAVKDAVKKMPGGGHMDVVPDGTPLTPADIKAGKIHASDAEAFHNMMKTAESIPGGMDAIQSILDKGGKVTIGVGDGSYQHGDTINIAKGMTPEQMVGVLAHEAHHLQTADADVHSKIHGKKEDYVQAALTNEAQAQAALFEARKQLKKPDGTVDTAPEQLGSAEYHEAYKKALEDAKTNPKYKTDFERREAAKQAGIEAVVEVFKTDKAKPSTSYDEHGNHIPGTPKTYEELYGQFHDDVKTGKVAATKHEKIDDATPLGPDNKPAAKKTEDGTDVTPTPEAGPEKKKKYATKNEDPEHRPPGMDLQEAADLKAAGYIFSQQADGSWTISDRAGKGQQKRMGVDESGKPIAVDHDGKKIEPKVNLEDPKVAHIKDPKEKAFELLGGNKGDDSEFGKFVKTTVEGGIPPCNKTMKDYGIDPNAPDAQQKLHDLRKKELIDRIKIKDGETPSFGTVRGHIKDGEGGVDLTKHVTDTVLADINKNRKPGDPPLTEDSPEYKKASYEKMKELAGKLGSGDGGALVEAWYLKVHGGEGDVTQVILKPGEHGTKVDRKPDLMQPQIGPDGKPVPEHAPQPGHEGPTKPATATLRDIKSTQEGLTAKDVEQLTDSIRAIKNGAVVDAKDGTKKLATEAAITMTDGEAARKSAKTMAKLMHENPDVPLSFEVFGPDGQPHTVRMVNPDGTPVMKGTPPNQKPVTPADIIADVDSLTRSGKPAATTKPDAVDGPKMPAPKGSDVDTTKDNHTASSFKPEGTDPKGQRLLNADSEHGPMQAKVVGDNVQLKFPDGMPPDQRKAYAEQAMKNLGFTPGDTAAFLAKVNSGDSTVFVNQKLHASDDVAKTQSFAQELANKKVASLGGDLAQGDFTAACSKETVNWQNKFAAQGEFVPIMDFPGPGGVEGHRFMVSKGKDGEGLIIDPTFGQFFTGDQKKLPNGQSQYEPFVGTYGDMKKRVQEAIDHGLMDGIKPGTPAEKVLQDSWGIKPPKKDGSLDFADGMKPFTGEGSVKTPEGYEHPGAVKAKTPSDDKEIDHHASLKKEQDAGEGPVMPKQPLVKVPEGGLPGDHVIDHVTPDGRVIKKKVSDLEIREFVHKDGTVERYYVEKGSYDPRKDPTHPHYDGPDAKNVKRNSANDEVFMQHLPSTEHEIHIAPDGKSARSIGPDGVSTLHLQPDGSMKRIYEGPPTNMDEAVARKKVVFEESAKVIAKRDAGVRDAVDKSFQSGAVKTPDGTPAVVVDKVILGAGGGAVQDYNTHTAEQGGKGAADQNGVPKILSLAAGADPWQGRHELMGQTPNQLSNPDNGLTAQPKDFSHTPNEFARSDDYATAVAHTRAESGMAVLESKITNVVKDNSNPPAKYRVDIEVTKKGPDGKPVMGPDGQPVREKRAVYCKDVDVAMGPGPDRTLAKDGVMHADEEKKLRAAGKLAYGDEAVGATFNPGEKVLVSGGGASAAWGAHRANDSDASVDWVGRPHAEVEKVLRPMESRLKDIDAQLKTLPKDSAERLKLEQEHGQLTAKRQELLLADAFKGANLPRNQDIVHNKEIQKEAKSIKKVDGPLPATDAKNPGKLMVTFSDGSVGYYDRIVVSHGQDASGEGGVHAMLTKPGGILADKLGGPDGKTVIEKGEKLKPIVGADGKVLGMQSADSDDGGGIRLVGAAATPGALLKHMAPDDAAHFTELMNQRKFGDDISQNSQGVDPGIEVWADSWKGLNQGQSDFGKPGPAPAAKAAKPAEVAKVIKLTDGREVHIYDDGRTVKVVDPSAPTPVTPPAPAPVPMPRMPAPRMASPAPVGGNGTSNGGPVQANGALPAAPHLTPGQNTANHARMMPAVTDEMLAGQTGHGQAAPVEARPPVKANGQANPVEEHGEQVARLRMRLDSEAYFDADEKLELETRLRHHEVELRKALANEPDVGPAAGNGSATREPPRTLADAQANSARRLAPEPGRSEAELRDTMNRYLKEVAASEGKSYSADYDAMKEECAQFRREIKSGQRDYMDGNVDDEHFAEMKHHIDKISDEQMAALRGYTSGDYEKINAVLRNPAANPEMYAKLQTYIQTAKDGLANLPNFEGTVYRGAQMKQEWMGSYQQALENGGTIKETAFASTSHSFRQADAFLGQPVKPEDGPRVPTMFTIQSATGKRVEFLSYKAREAEVLFPPGTEFKVLSMEHKNGRMEIVLKEVPPQDGPTHHFDADEDFEDEDED